MVALLVPALQLPALLVVMEVQRTMPALSYSLLRGNTRALALFVAPPSPPAGPVTAEPVPAGPPSSVIAFSVAPPGPSVGRGPPVGVKSMSSSHSTFMSPAAKQYLLPGWFSFSKMQGDRQFKSQVIPLWSYPMLKYLSSPTIFWSQHSSSPAVSSSACRLCGWQWTPTSRRSAQRWRRTILQEEVTERSNLQE